MDLAWHVRLLGGEAGRRKLQGQMDAQALLHITGYHCMGYHCAAHA